MDFVLERESAFSFACRTCGRCCSGKVIMVGPHEALGMARLLGTGTTEFLARFTDNGGTTLRWEAGGRCVFVTAEGGCRVHPRRPLVCRLYPLGRAIDGRGGERFAVFPRQEGCEAEFGTGGTVAAFLESQGVGPYFEWSRLYGEVYGRMVALLERLGVEGKIEAPPGVDLPGGVDRPVGSAGGGEDGEDPGTGGATLPSWQDIDASLAEYCAAKGIPVPEDVEGAVALHLRAMGEWLDGLESSAG